MGERFVVGYQDLFAFVKDNKERLVDYLSTSIPRGSLISWGVNHHMVIKTDYDFKRETIVITTFSDYEYQDYINNKYPHSYKRVRIGSDQFRKRARVKIYDQKRNISQEDVSSI